MPTGLRRYYGGGEFHFITCSVIVVSHCSARAWRRDLFLQVLEQVRRRYQFVVVGYVVMPEHFHLLMSEPQGHSPSTALQALKLGFARRVLAAQSRRQKSVQAALFDPPPHPIWQARFYDFNVWSARKCVEKLRYMHRNPVKRGLVTSPELWRWSSGYRAYAFDEPGPVQLNAWKVLRLKAVRPAVYVAMRRCTQVSKIARGAPTVCELRTEEEVFTQARELNDPSSLVGRHDG